MSGKEEKKISFSSALRVEVNWVVAKAGSHEEQRQIWEQVRESHQEEI